jgi:phage baseplate assembly protein W
MNFDRHPVTGLLAKITNEDAIKQSIRNLVLTTMTERFYRPTLGSKIKSLMFDPIDVLTEDMLNTSIANCVKQEPRAKLLRVDVIGVPDNNAYHITVYFECVNLPGQSFAVSMILKRVR